MSPPLQATHAAPLTPQVPLFCWVTQVLFWQHPGQLALVQLGTATHEKPLQICVPPLHWAQALPPDPQAEVVLPVWQTLFESRQPWHGGVSH
jgi:hypothetical protein